MIQGKTTSQSKVGKTNIIQAPKNLFTNMQQSRIQNRFHDDFRRKVKKNTDEMLVVLHR